MDEIVAQSSDNTMHEYIPERKYTRKLIKRNHKNFMTKGPAKGYKVIQ